MLNVTQIPIFRITVVLFVGIAIGVGLIFLSYVQNVFDWYLVTMLGLYLDISGAILIVLPILNILDPNKIKISDMNRFWVKIGIVVLIVGYVIQIITLLIANTTPD